MPVEKDSEVYNMNHRRRGIALIFNHKLFDSRLGLKQRNGTDADRDNLRLTLRQLDFEVRVYNDLAFKDMERILEDLAHDDHSDADCIFVSVLSHGELGILYAADQPYKPDRLWAHFNAEKCPTLAGKPKLFFVQVRNLKNNLPYGGLGEACNAKLASLAFEGASPPFCRLRRPLHKFLREKKSKKNFEKKNIAKKIFFRFSKIFFRRNLLFDE